MKSHETLGISKIEVNPKGISFYMTIENRIQGGTFCVDMNTFLIYPDGTRSKLVSASGIPVCPDSHKFKTPGEKLDFVLLFPPLKEGTGWIDLVEECSDHCFSFYGVTLDNELNQKVNESFILAEGDEASRGIISLIDLIGEVDIKNYGIEGLLYLTIVKLSDEAGSKAIAAEWYKKMKSSGAPRVGEYLKYLNDNGIRY
ncbi:MAG: hypothetical protein V1903_00745 [Bacteroidota bacterium]